MPVATLVGTPDPDEDLHRRVEALEGVLAGELQRLILSLQQPSTVTEDRIQRLERAVKDLTDVVLALRDNFQGHVHHSAPQTTGGVA